MERKIVRHLKTDPFATSAAIREEYNLHISTPTIRRLLLRNNLKAKSRRKVSLLSKQYLNNKLEFTKQHLNWPMHNWRNIL